MDYNELNNDTKNIVEVLCENMKCSKENAIDILVKFGMLSMISSVSSKPGDIVQKIIMSIAKSAELTEAAKVYRAVWKVS